MATRFKYSIAKGQRKKDVTIAAGDTVGTDTVTVNVDATTMSHGDFVQCLAEIQRMALENKWFPV